MNIKEYLDLISLEELVDIINRRSESYVLCVKMRETSNQNSIYTYWHGSECEMLGFCESLKMDIVFANRKEEN